MTTAVEATPSTGGDPATIRRLGGVLLTGNQPSEASAVDRRLATRRTASASASDSRGAHRPR